MSTGQAAEDTGGTTTTRLRIWLAVLTAPTLLSGVWALLGPASWYRDYGAGIAPPSAFGAYNQHFIQDIGGGYLAVAAALIWAMLAVERNVVRAALIAFLAFNLPHLVIHLLERGELTQQGYLFVNGGLAFGVAVSLWAWRLTARLR